MDAAHTYGAPFVSGKDSLNNEYLGTDGERHAVPPTLVITAVAHVPDAASVVTSDLKQAGDLVVLVGATVEEFAGSHLDKVLGEPDVAGVVPAPDPMALDRFQAYIGRCAPDWRAPATTAPRVGSLWPWPRCASAATSASRSPNSPTRTRPLRGSPNRRPGWCASWPRPTSRPSRPRARGAGRAGRVIAEPALSGQDLGPSASRPFCTVWSPR
ncbi:MAG: hypothetical protein R2705_17885 [Ilumatobacteraceae bacterium]